MTTPDRRNSGSNGPVQIDGAHSSPTHFRQESSADGKFRLVERLTGNASVTISREYVFDDNGDIANQHGNLLVITTGGRDDEILIDQRPDGTLDVNVNGMPFVIVLGAGQELAVRSRGGGDRVVASSRVKVNMVVDAGDGNDFVITGDGNDSVFGRAGNDTLQAGDGDDYIVGEDGDDAMDGGAGNDVLYGGRDNDTLWGGGGSDFLDGSQGDDRLSGDAGNDVLSDTLGTNQLAGGTGTNRIYSRKDIDPDLGSSITIVGTPAFRERVAADFDTLRGSPLGEQILAALDLAAQTTGNSVTITELTHERNGFAQATGRGDPYLTPGPRGTGAVPGTGDDVTIGFNPSHLGTGGKPIIVLYHELSHAYNMVTGTLQRGIYAGPGIDQMQVISGQTRGVQNFERQAVGLPNTGLSFDSDANATTPPIKDNPAFATENAIRAEMGVDPRESYRRAPRSTPTATPSPPQPSRLRSDPNLGQMVEALLAGDSVALQRGLTDLASTDYAQQSRAQAAATLDSRALEPTVQESNTSSPEPRGIRR